MNLRDKRAIVTGSTRGIGLAVAQALLDQGVHVVISSRHQTDIDRTRSSLVKPAGTRVPGYLCDVRDAAQVQALVGYAVESLGGVDILVNNAGIGIFRSVAEMQPEEWRAVLATNLDGVFYACHFAIPELRKGEGGFIINISSLAGKNAFPGGGAYNASKFALTGFSEALMQEVRYQNIRVAYIMPGSVATSFSGRDSAQNQDWKMTSEDVAQVVVETLQRSSRCLTSRIEMRPSKPPQE